MTDHCEHCGRPYRAGGGVRYGVTFGPVATRIIDTVERAGPDGINPTVLRDVVYRDRRTSSVSSIKSYISQINSVWRDVGAGVQIYGGRHCCYRIHRERAA